MVAVTVTCVVTEALRKLGAREIQYKQFETCEPYL
jgi:hypothetical protein